MGTINYRYKEVQVLTKASDRKLSIINNTPAYFPVAENKFASGSKPFIELHDKNEVQKWMLLILLYSKKHNLDPDLVKAIMYMETTHGWYDAINPFRRTILPMNVHFEYWKKLVRSKSRLNCPANNIELGTIILKRISDRVDNNSIRKIATLYNSLAKEQVTDYGARVEVIYKSKLWMLPGGVK